MKRKLTFSVPVAADDGVLSATSGLSVTILKHGAQFRSAFSITASSSLSCPMWSQGSIPDSGSIDVLHVAADGTVSDGSMTMQTGTIADAAGGVTITLSTGAGSTIEAAKDDWLVRDFNSGTNEASLYEGPTSTTPDTDNPLTLSADGMVEVWTDEPIVDIYVQHASITNRYFIGVKTEAADVIDVTEFGAVDSLTVDSTAAVQSAIDYAGVNGGVLYFPKGDYRIESALSFDGGGSEGLTLKGVGPELSRFIVIGDIDCLSLVDTWGVVIDGIDFHHAGTNPTTESRMIMLDGANRTRIQNCLFTNCWTAIRTGKATSASKTQNLFITDCMVDIGHSESHATQILFNIIDTIGLVVENVLTQWGAATIDAGWSIDDGVDTAAFTNVACTQAGGGVGIAFRTISSTGGSDHECRWVKFTNCYAEGGTEQGFYLTAGYDQALTNCYSLASLHGLHINGAEDVRVENCLFKENDQSGIKVESGDNVLIANSTIARNSTVTPSAAISVDVGVGGRILGNFIHQTHAGGTNQHTQGIALAADEWICSGNEIIGGSSHGINVTADRCIITGNICKDNTGYGVAIQSSAANTILTSNISDNNTAGDWSDAGTSTIFGHNYPALAPQSKYAEMYMSSAAASAAINPTGTPIKIAGTTAAGDVSGDFSVTTTTGGKITYDGTEDITVKISAALSMQHSGAPATVSLYLADGGNVIAKSKIDRAVGSTDVGAAALQCITTLSTNDYIEIYVDSTILNDTVTIDFLNLVVEQL